ncbi:hypothetical protein WOLCODRAFT_140602 [Wolfiporia cocos MD-104 SS10]|uniref:Uncharacterized protein n=1 Tax=Wolfiporia cocos (strain MD-104) TaxID=742152 RepID=A0A2H3J5A2_WOLCO|nr:hypothetical protein WOLCODRAFT_140602 [Wolfiporia cocos MD-104 SS10]
MCAAPAAMEVAHPAIGVERARNVGPGRPSPTNASVGRRKMMAQRWMGDCRAGAGAASRERRQVRLGIRSG